jgi:hypothetical protein
MVSSKRAPKPPKRRLSSSGNGYTAPKPVQHARHRYSRSRKKQVLLFLSYHRIPKTPRYAEDGSALPPANPTRVPTGLEEPVEDGFRRPTMAEAAAYFKISGGITTIQGWWRIRESIWKGAMPKSMPPKWPRLEKELLKRFIAARGSNKIVIVH